MVDTFTNNFDLVLQATGTNGGTWGTDWNNNGTTPLDSILGGTQSIVMSSSNVTLTLSQWQNGAFKITGTLTGNLNLILPLSPNAAGGTPGVGGKFIVDNQTTGAFTITVLTAATGSTGVVAPQGFRTFLYSDTINVFYVNPANVANGSLAAMAAWTIKLNNSGSPAPPQDVTIDALTNKPTPLAADEVPIWDAAGAAMKKATLLAIAAAVASGIPAPTVQRFTSGSGTYTPTPGMVRIRVRMCGSGGGGSGATANNGSDGGDTSFGGWTALRGHGGIASGNGGLGGTGGVNGTGTLVIRFPGGSGTGGSPNGQGASFAGGPGGVNPFGGTAGGILSTGTGLNGATNTGAGASGGSANFGSQDSGSGGGAGEYVEFWMTAAQVGAGLAYVVAAGGPGGVAGGNAGGVGANGVIIVEEFYS